MKWAAWTVAVLAAATVLFVPATARSAFPGSNGKLAFASDMTGDFEIYTMNPDGTGQVQLTTSAGDDLYPVWSADGTKIAFTSARSGSYDIFSMTAAGANQTRLTTDPASDLEPAWSPSGTRIAFVSDRNSGLQLWTMDANGANQLQVTNTVGAYNVDPVWSPDGSRIAFTTSRDGNEEIYLVNPDGSNPTRLTNDAGSDAGPAFSPDGTKIAFQSDRAGSRDIWVMNADGSNQVQLTTDPGFDSSPAWSPDGTKIVFQSNRDGDFEIFVMDANGGNQTQLTTNTALDRLADWQPIVAGGSDTTPPVLTLPASMTVNATGPSGAVVSFSATASDNTDPNPAVTCVPPSGSTFAIGTTTVNCTATDASGNSSNGSFTVAVAGPTDQLVDLVQSIIGSTNLPPAIKNRLLSAARAFNPNSAAQVQVVCNTLASFIVTVQRLAFFRLIPAAQAAAWIADAQRIRAVLAC